MLCGHWWDCLLTENGFCRWLMKIVSFITCSLAIVVGEILMSTRYRGFVIRADISIKHRRYLSRTISPRHQWDYLFSSARHYADMESLLDVITIDSRLITYS